MRKNHIVIAMATAFTFLALVLTIAGTNPSNFAFAQGDPAATGEVDPGTPGEVGTTNNSEVDYKPLNLTGPETIESLEGIEGSNAAFLDNDTSISNPNNTAIDATDVNEQEACIPTSNQTDDCI
ncbi:MAG: hypothetical protein AB7V56_12930 [Candidatus Nitrosocosmicus sp.]|jgi:hypothetical protein|uniref:hypothetical protein n=1 Tax=Candidatus Nitrosocosmicus agrestis TaxID=2563600 RepID=UPI00122E97DA|nr:hypothetical protein [Candidatus Nitrosocosmicus sp. SS]KAA2279721.1 hypothetical protein F1Z66_12605 [Candidatus Nitrosocosmicus sp. SS]KAF0868793.1 hypothetical protein E5N71_07230 [Candidatus Nitrosocosmicus sp. SS]HET6590374.1 hypothetical protein [Candidatus Nitrosocosmicus sp.]